MSLGIAQKLRRREETYSPDVWGVVREEARGACQCGGPPCLLAWVFLSGAFFDVNSGVILL